MTALLTADQAWRFIAVCAASTDSADRDVAIAVVDAGGHLLAFRRAETIGHFYVDLALAKARAAAALRRSPAAAMGHWQSNPGVMAALTGLGAHVLLPSAGAFVIRADDGSCRGGLGIAGPATGTHAEQLGLRIAAEVGLALEK
ncbi:MAG: heme-binding protein [Rhodospirillaceae bacterium]|nr:heme-binding protein [Rhodospirillaceae bacterium]